MYFIHNFLTMFRLILRPSSSDIITRIQRYKHGRYFNVLLTVHLGTTLVSDQLDAQCSFLSYVYYSPLHVSSNIVLIIRRSNCINTASGIVTVCKWPSGMQVEREFPLDVRIGRPLTESNYTRCCISTV